MKDKQFNTILFTVDKYLNGYIIEADEDLYDKGILDGSSMEDNYIELPKDIEKGVYTGNISITGSIDRFGESDMEIHLTDVVKASLKSETIKEKEVRLLRKKIKDLEEELLFKDEITIEGNKGGNVVMITKVDENKLHLKIGDCCVYTVDAILTAEALSGFLTKIFLDSNKKSFVEYVYDNLRWPKEYNDEVISGCLDL